MRKRFLRSTLAALLLISFAPSLLYCGQVNLAPQLIQLALGETANGKHDRFEYAPIIPPETSSEFLQQTAEQTQFLGDLPIDQVMARDLIKKLLGAFLIEFEDEIATLLKSFGIELPDDWTNIPLEYILQLIKLRSYDQEIATGLVEQWQTEMTPEQEETLRRLWLSQTMVRTGFDSGLAMTEDATEGLYDLIDLIYGSTNVMKKISGKFENLPIVGSIIKKIRLMISARIIFALNNGVDLITSKMREPGRSRVRAVFTALTTTYIKWTGIQVGDGFGGISSELLTKIGAKMLGKFLLLMPPRIGFVSRTKAPAKYGAERALAGLQTGTFDQAAAKILDDGNDSTPAGVLESMVKTVLKKRKLSFKERQIANIAGAISQVAQLIHFIDPSSFVKIVAIGAALLAGGLQLHSVFNSSIALYRIPSQVDQGVRLAFDPESGSGNPVQEPALEEHQASTEYVSYLTARIEEAKGNFEEAALKLIETLETPNVEAVAEAAELLDGSSLEVRHAVQLVSTFRIPSDGGPEEMRSLLAEGMMDHDLRAAALHAQLIGYVFKPEQAQRQPALEKLHALRQQTELFMQQVVEVAQSGRMYSGAYLALVAPSAVEATEEIEIEAILVAAGSEPTAAVQVELILPKQYQLLSGSNNIQSTAIIPGHDMALSWVIKRPPGKFKATTFVISVKSGNAPEVNQSILITD